MEKKFYNISEVSKMISRNASTIRFWETKFSKIKPLKRAGGRRFYRQEDIELLKEINYLLQNKKLTIDGAKKYLQSKNNQIEDSVTETLREIVGSLKEVQEIL